MARRKKNTDLPEDYNKFLKYFQSQDDRGATLVAGALLDQLLLEILLAFFVDAKESEEILGINSPGFLETFGAREKIAFALGLISESERKQIYYIRKIRNEFAHSWDDISFEEQRISDFCKNLKSPILDILPIKSEREAFTLSVAILATQLQLRALDTSRHSRKIRPDTKIKHTKI